MSKCYNCGKEREKEDVILCEECKDVEIKTTSTYVIYDKI